ncbi:MAG: translation initiation factor IF-2 [Rhodospirillales bacterium]|nr:translation initiation factor IF-2 [Rhodospirillales bacterium]
MTDIDERKAEDRVQSAKPSRLELKKTVEGGQVRQSFSHGRSKMVTVEVRKKRTFAADGHGRVAEVRRGGGGDAQGGSGAGVSREGAAAGLTNQEKAARARALQDAIRAEDERATSEAKRAAAAKAEAAAAADAALRAGVEAAAEIEATETPSPPPTEAAAETKAETAAETALETAADDSERADEAALPPAASEAAAAEAPAAETATATATEATAEATAEATEPGAPAAPAAPAQVARPKAGPADAKTDAKGKAGEESDDDDRRGRVKRSLRTDARKPTPVARRDEAIRRSGKLTIVDALDEGNSERVRSLASVRRAREKERAKQLAQRGGEPQKIVREVVIPESITVQELANRMAERSVGVIKALMKMGIMATINHVIDADTAELIAGDFGHKVKRVSDADVEIGLKGEDDEDETLLPRPPVVTVMGHVDHGKTSLLDALRRTDVVAHEAGGITQHIGAYQVNLAGGEKITFIDTPGHAAFTQMRARGAKVTDIVVLVVAADDGVMPQTIEAIDHAKAADVPIIVAINKIDRPDANPARVRNELLQHSIVTEEMGGETLCVEVSAKQELNLDRLQEAILLQSEVLDLKANPDRAAEGVVIETKVERGRGSVATVLVQRGTLRVGDIFVAGAEWGRVRGLNDANGVTLSEAGPSMPVEVLGLNATPAAGDEVSVVENEARAREVSEFRQRRLREARTTSNRGTVEQIFSRIADGEQKTLPVLIKADVHGSAEAIVGALQKLGTAEVGVQIIHSGVGGINESDVALARASDALVIGFNVRANPQARESAKRDGIEIRYYSIIYNLTDDLKGMLSGMLSPVTRENLLGYAQIREVFNITKVGKVAGCMITEGMVRRGAKIRLLRDDVVIHEGDIAQLKRFKDDVREVKEGYDCGIAIANYNDIRVGDLIECFELEQIAQEL